MVMASSAVFGFAVVSVLFKLPVAARDNASDIDYDGCTSMAFGRSATVEGTVFATHTNDCSDCDPRIAYIPPKDYPKGSLRPIYPFATAYPRFVGGQRSDTYAAKPGQEDTVPVGFIAQVEHTYGYWEANYPLLNEHGLGFGESTASSHLIGQSRTDGGTALFSIGPLMQVAAERCKSARCAIEVMGKLAEDEGFFGEDPGEGGAGEHLSVVDPEEAWIFHITSGLNNRSGTWVAQRVPDNHVAVVANAFIIKEVNCSDTDNFMCSYNIFSNAREAKLCEFEKDSDFNWQRCYAPDIRTFSYLAGYLPIPYYTTLRLWRLQNLANPDLNLALTDNPWDYAFSVPVKNKVTRMQVMDYMRDHYEGTPYDMTQGILAGPLNNPNRIEAGHGMSVVPGEFARGISIPRTSYGVLVETKPFPHATESIAWFATDSPASSVFTPLFAGATSCSEFYKNGHMEQFTRDSAWWAFNFVANWMNINYRDMSNEVVYPAVQREQLDIMKVVEDFEKKWPADREELSSTLTHIQDDLVKRWWQMADGLVSGFNDGSRNYPNGTKRRWGYPAWYLQMIGFNDDFYKVQWVTWAALPPMLLRGTVAGAATSASNFLASAVNSAAFNSDSSFLPGVVIGAAAGAFSTFLLLSRRRGRGDDFVRLVE